jgi:hypothetical protein
MGDVVNLRLGQNIFEARVANGDVAGRVWLYAVDVSSHIFVPAFVIDPNDPRFRDTAKKHGLWSDE